MKISKDDFLLLTGLAEFHFKFSEYIRENDKEMFFRAIDYAQTFTNVEGVKFDYWHEDNKRFLKELSTLLHKKQINYDKFMEKYDDKKEGIDLWMNRKKTSKEDLLGINKYIMNFVHHARELDYDSFDLIDWMNFMKIVKYTKNDQKFIEYCRGQITRVLGPDSELLKELE